jgi:hypothetical protein
LKEGGLFIYNPVAPTNECVNLIRNLETIHGPVRYVVLGSLGVEHKGTLGAFASQFPTANIYYQPNQYSFPIDLPIAFYLPWGRKAQVIPTDWKDAPWSDDFEHAIMPILRAKSFGGFAETAFFHRSTQTLLVTDSIVRVDDEPPAIVQEDPRALLYHARDSIDDVETVSKALTLTASSSASSSSSLATLYKRGWRRMLLFALYFQPSGIRIQSLIEAFRVAKQVSPAVKAWGAGAIPFDAGLYPVSVDHCLL